ncbi:colanic acid/amylovoran biosynthesis protein [Geodermatophilus bullaregiensis]|uniref:polysaccharide pyruvyl transferase family protein n=1 Tax=Geodermatophilus bullaregiensis TaxID=1564160 RepID=UPI00195D0C59|nr:polysaccharide pyruvyl transferase family protein [Geodermatophilus bullaregiensis]MBM7806969.1 colanic acid/amylovoran biosynthesis protein [Geodermatophilus bullaregiensis]
MRILVEQSGYDLLNVGDIAMLQSCVRQLRRQWPDAEIEVVCNAADSLQRFCPGTFPVLTQFVSRPLIRPLRRRWVLAAEHGYKSAAPLMPIRRSKSHARPGRRSLRAAISRADLVVAAGGGYLCDPLWWHGAGVLTTIWRAQRLGCPTAMFGQGIGPLTIRPLRRLAATVLGNLDVLTLREGPSGLRFLKEEGLLSGEAPDRYLISGHTGPSRILGGGWLAVTGDDTLTDVVSENRQAVPEALLGVNVRVSGYSEVGQDLLSLIGETVADTARSLGMDLLALPVSQYSQEADLQATVRALAVPVSSTGPRLTAEPISSPEGLMRAAGRCRSVITGSYHAAVFALAQGVPVIGLSASGYYDQKFTGLRALYGDLVQTVDLRSAALRSNLESAIRGAVIVPVDVRAGGIVRSEEMAKRADQSYAIFAEKVNGEGR